MESRDQLAKVELWMNGQCIPVDSSSESGQWRHHGTGLSLINQVMGL